MREIVVLDYNPKWAENFQELKEVFLKELYDIPVEIEHVGSTSVTGLAAKPIIDIDIIVENDSILNQVIDRLERLGYKHMGDYGITGREALKPLSEAAPYKKGVNKWSKHNLYVCLKGCDSLENHLRFRNYLRNNEKARIKYSTLKRELARKYPYDIDLYVENKTDFITNILQKTGMSERAIKDITKANKAK